MSIATYMSTLPLPECTMSVNGKYMEEEVIGYRTSSVSGRDAFANTVNEQSIGEAGATNYLSKKIMPRDVIVKFDLTADSRLEHKRKHNLLKRFLSSPDTKFIFKDESDCYYIGTVSGITSTMANTSGMDIFSSTGEITIHCSDPYKYSTVEQTFTATASNGITSVTIVNDGSKAVPIDYTLINHHDNGYFGIVSDKGVIQIGKLEEVDGVVYQRSENLASIDSFAVLPDDHGINYAHPDQSMTGTLTFGDAEGINALKLATTGAEVPNSWCGGMKTLTLPADSNGVFGCKNFDVYSFHRFETVDIAAQTGIQNVSFLTADNEVICGFQIAKVDPVNNTAFVEFRVGDNAVSCMYFTPSYSDDYNPYNQGRGHNSVVKEGDKITFYWWGSRPSFVVPEVKDMICTKIQIAITNWAGRGLTKPFYLPRNWVHQLSFSKMNVDKWRDIPNRYKVGDVVLVDGGSTKVYVNGMPSVNEEIKGSTYFLAEPGETVVQFYYSTFCDVAPTITAKIREAWL